MAEFTRELFLQALEEWGRYAEAFKKLPPDEQADFLKTQGYGSMKDILVHVAVWWEEARGIIADAIRHPERPARKYDFAEFNAAALKRFANTSETEFMAWYETERQRMTAAVSGLTDSQLQLRGISSWLDGVVLTHLKEHGVDAPRFLIIDMLQREWGEYVARFEALDSVAQTEFLKQQGFVRIQDLLAHIIAWWEHGIAVIEASSSGAASEEQDVDDFNAQAVARFKPFAEEQVVAKFEETRLTLASLVDMLPDEVLSKTDVQSWLRADVINHYYEHAI